MAIIEFTAHMHIGTRLEDPGVWVAWCPSLDLHTQAGSRDEAGKAICEATALWFEDCVRRGTIDAALREVGYCPTDSAAQQAGFDHVEVGGGSYARRIDYLEDAPDPAIKYHWELCRPISGSDHSGWRG